MVEEFGKILGEIKVSSCTRHRGHRFELDNEIDTARRKIEPVAEPKALGRFTQRHAVMQAMSGFFLRTIWESSQKNL